MRFTRTSSAMLGVGSLVFGTWGLIHPRSLTDLMGDDPALGRWLGLRDLAVGAALLTSAGPLPLAARTACDLHDAYRLRERSPRVAAGAALFAVWGVAALAVSLSPNDGPEQEVWHTPDELIV